MTAIPAHTPDASQPLSQRERDLVHRLWSDYAVSRKRHPDFVLSRLAHGSFVSHRHRYVYLETPKTACTEIKHFIAGLENAGANLERRRPYLRETRRSMLVHQRRYIDLPTLLDTNADDLRAITSGKSDFLIFALVRNPFSRLVSAFESKVRLCEPGFRSIGLRFAGAEADADTREAFAGFVASELEPLALEMGEHHFVPQEELLLPDLLPYSKIFQVERFKEFEMALFAHLRQHGVDGPLSFTDRNRSFYPDWRFYYDEATAARVAEFYRADFTAFGYDENSWRTERTLPQLRTSESEAYWRQAVIERNEMIEFLYELLRSET